MIAITGNQREANILIHFFRSKFTECKQAIPLQFVTKIDVLLARGLLADFYLVLFIISKGI